MTARSTRPKSIALKRYESVPGEHYGTPKELWGFRTEPRSGSALAVARAFLAANARLLGLDGAIGTLEHQITKASLGARHVIFQQSHRGRRVHRAYVTVHVSNGGQVYLSKNRAVPAGRLPDDPEFHLSGDEVVRRARRALGGGSNLVARKTEPMWFPSKSRLLPSFRVRLRRERPAEDWIVYVHARSGRILSRYDNLSEALQRGLVFDPSPVTALGGHEKLLGPGKRPRRPPKEAYRTVTLRGLDRNGRLDGARVTTNATSAKRRVRRQDGQFLFASKNRGFEEVMVYHHVDSVIRYLEKLGFRGPRAIFDDRVRVNVNGTREDNSWYSPSDRIMTFGTGDIDDAEDGETIVHELGHAIQDAIVPDFGQSPEAAAMGEGFGDYLAASFFAEKKPEKYRPAVMTWDGLLIGLREERRPPALRYVDWDVTFDAFDAEGDEHVNGEIWSATLWDIRSALGRETADRLIVESHFQLDGFTTFARGARAIIDADANLEDGRNRTRLRRIFEARRIGPL